MNWFKCDDSGNILINMHSVLELLKNVAIPELQSKQEEMLNIIKSMTGEEGSGGITAGQLSQILGAIEAIPTDTILDNQGTILEKVNNNTTNIANVKSVVDEMKNISLPDIKNGQKDMVKNISDTGSKIENIVSMLDAIYGTVDDEVIGTLVAGETSVTLTDPNITEGISVEVHTSVYGVNPISVTPSDGSITILFPAQTDDVGVKVVYSRSVDWDSVLSDIASNSNTTIDGGVPDNPIKLKSKLIMNEESTLPFRFANGGAVEYNGKLHILGGFGDIDGGTNADNYYTWDGSNWENTNKGVPCKFEGSSIVVYNNTLYALVSEYNGGNVTSFILKDNEQWCEDINLIGASGYDCPKAVVLEDGIHMICIGDYPEGVEDTYGVFPESKHFKFDGTKWIELDKLPFCAENGCSAMLNGEWHIVAREHHYKWDGSNWIKVSTLPILNQGSVVGSTHCLMVIDNSLYIVIDKEDYSWIHKFNGVEWVPVYEMTEEWCYEYAVTYNGKTHILGCGFNTNIKHRSIDIVYEKVD